jgi:RecA/RadA recombinase
VIEIHGNEHSGKSTLTYGIVSAYQKFTGEPAVIYDFERTGDWNYLHQIGVDDASCELIMPDCIQDAEKRTLEFMESGVRLFVFDSIVRMREEVDRKLIMSGKAHNTTPGEHARAMERFFVNMLTPAARYDCVFLMVNQPRARIEASKDAQYAIKYPSFTNLPYILPGGKTCRFTPSVMIETMTHKAIRAGSEQEDAFLIEPGTGVKGDKQDFAATRVKIRILKNKTNDGGYREGAMYLRKGVGFDDNVTVRELAREYGFIANVGKKWYVGKSAEEAIAGYPDQETAIEDLVIKQNPEVLAKLRVLVKEAVRNDETGRHVLEVDENTERYMTGLDDDAVELPVRAAFEVEEDLG